MSGSRLLLLVVPLALAAGPSAAPSALPFAPQPPAAATATKLDPDRVAWRSLHYKASKLLLTGTAEVEVESVAGGGSGVLAPDGRPLVGRESLLLTLRSRFLGRGSLLRLWLDPEDGTALARTQLETGRGRDQKTYRFGEDGVDAWRHPPSDEVPDEVPAEGDEGTMGDFETSHHPYGLPHDRPVTEPSALFYHLAAGAPWSLGETREIFVFTRRQVLAAALVAEERLALKVHYEEVAGDEVAQRHGEIPVLRLSIRARSLDPGRAESDFEFLGLAGDIDLYLDESRRIPVQVSGRVPPVGRIHVKLRRVVLRAVEETG